MRSENCDEVCRPVVGEWSPWQWQQLAGMRRTRVSLQEFANYTNSALSVGGERKGKGRQRTGAEIDSLMRR